MPSRSGVYRALVRAGVIEVEPRRSRREHWRRWERGSPMELWQLDLVGGFLLANGSRAKALTGIDDHSRFCVSAALMPRERTQPVCDAFAASLRAHGVPQQVLTDNGRVFTGRFNHPPVEVLFDRICRENGIEHLLTAPRSPTTPGKIERFHRTLRAEFLTGRVFRHPGPRPGRVRRLGCRLQPRPAAPVPGHRHPGQQVPRARRRPRPAHPGRPCPRPDQR